MEKKRNYKLLLFIPLIIFMARAPVAAKGISSAEFRAAGEAMALITVKASTPGFNWSMPSAAPALDVFVDGEFLCNLVLFAGEKPFDYRLLAGPVAKGPHRIELKSSTARKSSIAYEIDGIAVELSEAGTPAYEAYSRAPFLYGREENDISDTPALLWVETQKHNDGNTEYRYSYVWTNEDGGTQTASLMARYGRVVDIEFSISIVAAPDGRIVSELFQTYDHKIAQFSGKRIGARPVMRTATRNNVFDDRGESSLLFSLAPVIVEGQVEIRETMLDSNPWINRIMAEEMKKEGKLTENGEGADIAKVADPRHYVYVDFDISSMLPIFKLDVGAKLKADGKWHSSARGIVDLGIDLNGRRRSAVPVGRMATPGDIEAVRIRLMAEYPANAANTVKVLDIMRVIVLDENYNPQIIKLKSPQKAALKNRTPEFIVPVEKYHDAEVCK